MTLTFKVGGVILWEEKMTAIPDFSAKVTSIYRKKEIFKKHPAVEKVLLNFREYHSPECIKRITVSRMNKDLIFFDNNQPLRKKWFGNNVLTNIVGQVILIGDGEEGSNAAILDSTKIFKVSATSKRPNLVRDMLAYDGTSYLNGKRVTSILVVYVVSITNGADTSVLIKEVVATLYKLPNEPKWLSQTLIKHDKFFDKVTSIQYDDMNHRDSHNEARKRSYKDLILWAEDLRRKKSRY